MQSAVPLLGHAFGQIKRITVHAPSFITKKNDAGEDVPFRYNVMTTNPAWLGYSDHFALTVKLKAVK